MTDTYTCPAVKSHPRSAREWGWELTAAGHWRAYVDCGACASHTRIAELATPELYADLLPPEPPALRPMI